MPRDVLLRLSTLSLWSCILTPVFSQKKLLSLAFEKGCRFQTVGPDTQIRGAVFYACMYQTSWIPHFLFNKAHIQKMPLLLRLALMGDQNTQKYKSKIKCTILNWGRLSSAVSGSQTRKRSFSSSLPFIWVIRADLEHLGKGGAKRTSGTPEQRGGREEEFGKLRKRSSVEIAFIILILTNLHILTPLFDVWSIDAVARS